MFPSRTPGDIEAEILMHRTTHKGSFLLVEGPDDRRFWLGRISSEADCQIIRADGKRNVVGAMEKLDARQFKGALGIVDDDCDSLEGQCYVSRNLLATDGRDLECLLLRSTALERLLAELGEPEKIRRFKQRSGVSVKARLIENGLAFGRLRWLSKRQGWGLDFDKQLTPSRFIDRKAWSIDEANLLATTAPQAGLPDAEALRLLLDALPPADPWLICQGHDLVEILKLGLQEALGNLKPTYGKDSLAGSLRLAFHAAELALTRLYREILGWEQTNVPYRILPRLA
jgi:hypothetical protein